MTYLQELRADIKRDLHFEWENEQALHELFSALRGRPCNPGEINLLFEALYRDRLLKAKTITLFRDHFIEVLRRESSNFSRRVPTVWFEFLSTPPDLQGWKGALLFSVTSSERLFHRRVEGGMLFVILFGQPDRYQIGFLNLVVSREDRQAATAEFAAPGTCGCEQPESVLSEYAQVRVVIDPDDEESTAMRKVQPVTLSDHDSRVIHSLAEGDGIFDRHDLKEVLTTLRTRHLLP